MLLNPTLDKLSQMKLYGLHKGYRNQLEHPGEIEGLSFQDRLGLLVDREWTERESRRLQSRLKAAKIPQQASLEDLDFHRARGLERGQAMALADCQWIQRHANLLITGPTGVGKSFLACAYAQKACREGYRAVYHRLSRLVQDLELANADGRYLKLIKGLARMDLIVLDDWGLAPLNGENRRDLLEIMEDRYDRGSTIITSQFPISDWHQLLGDPTMADAILDRLVHRSYRFELKGESMRKKYTKLTPKEPSGS